MREEDDVEEAFGVGFVPLDEGDDISLGDEISVEDLEPIPLETTQEAVPRHVMLRTASD